MKKNCIEEFVVSVSKSLFSDKYFASGYVKFKKGDISGRQDFGGEDFNDVVLKMKEFINQELK